MSVRPWTEIADARPAIRRRILSPKWVHLFMTVLMVVVAIPLWVYVLANAAPSKSSAGEAWWTVALVLVFMAVEARPLRIKIRDEAMLLTLTELPLVFGLLRAGPAYLVGIATLCAAAITYLVLREKWRNALMNLSFSAAECGIAAAVYTAFASQGAGTGGLFLALLIGLPLGTLVCGLTIGLTHRVLGVVETIGRPLLRTGVASASSAVLALVGYLLWFGVTDWTHPGADHGSTLTGRLLCLGLGAALVVLYRVYYGFLHQQEDLGQIYEFGSQVVTVGSEAPGWQKLLEQIRVQFNAELVVLHLGEALSGFRTLSVGPDGPVEVPLPNDDDPIIRLAGQDGGVRVCRDRTANAAILAALAGRDDAYEVMAVELRSGERSVGYLEVRDRQNRWQRLSKNDLRLLGAFGQHTATAIDKLGLMDTLRHEAHYDALTGLFNWRGLIIQIETMMQDGAPVAVLLVELGILSEVNNAIGHVRGDQLLSAAATRAREELPDELVVAHLESDRFAVVVQDEIDNLPAVAAQLLDVLARPYVLNGIEIEPHARVGVAHTHTEEASDADTAVALVQQAEMALTAAQNSDDQLRTYGTSMGDVFRRRFQLVTQFRRAIDMGAITVDYQPKVDLVDQGVVGVEALVRWAHPELGAISPTEFVEAIEATGSIDALLEHVLDMVLTQIALWNKRNLRVGVAVNLSARNLNSPNFPSRVADALAAHQVDASQLTFEITESRIMADPERSLPILRELHAMKIKLSIDDFGTGYSSLAYLRRLPIDEIKIDRSFVQGMITDLSDLAIVRAIIDLGHSLGLRVVAEGVEEEAARDALRNLRCDEMQGYLLSRPLAIDKLEAWFQSRTMRHTRGPNLPQVLRLDA